MCNLDPALRSLGIIMLCLVAACDAVNDRGEAGAIEKPLERSKRLPEIAARSDKQAPHSAESWACPDCSSDSGEPPPAIDSELFNSLDILDELQALSWEDVNEVDSRANYLLERLRVQGGSDVVPLIDFLLESRSASPQLRQAVLEILLGLRLPEAEDVAVELLASQPSAMEAWLLGRYLESVQPDKYTTSIRSAGEQALIEADPAEILPAEFFTFLAQLGNEETALLLSELPPHQRAYGSMALVFIPDGGGLPMLEHDARVFEAGKDTWQARLALQLLAQQAPQYPNAAAVLIELAESRLVPHDLWPYLLEIVAGNWELTVSEPTSSELVGSHTYYHADGSQVVYRAARQGDELHDDLRIQRLYLLDRLQPLAPPDLVAHSDG